MEKQARRDLGPDEEMASGKKMVTGLDFLARFIMVHKKIGGIRRQHLVHLSQPAVEGVFLAEGLPPGMGPQPPGHVHDFFPKQPGQPGELEDPQNKDQAEQPVSPAAVCSC
jgi:hypothetical protein